MREYYPSGVHESRPTYDKKHNRDGDNWTCEKNLFEGYLKDEAVFFMF